jgi:cell division septum initiation protein DivIVA
VEDFMDILAAIQREERKLEKQLHKLQHQLNGVRAAANALGDSTGKEIKVVKKRVLSAAGRAAIIKAAKKRWSKVRKQAKKVAG